MFAYNNGTKMRSILQKSFEVLERKAIKYIRLKTKNVSLIMILVDIAI